MLVPFERECGCYLRVIGDQVEQNWCEKHLGDGPLIIQPGHGVTEIEIDYWVYEIISWRNGFPYEIRLHSAYAHDPDGSIEERGSTREAWHRLRLEWFHFKKNIGLNPKPFWRELRGE